VRLNGADPRTRLGQHQKGRHGGHEGQGGRAAQNAAPADPFGDHAPGARSHQLPDQGGSHVAAQGDLSDGTGEAVADRRHAHRHDPTCRGPAENATDEEHSEIGSQGGREQA
jgi:hypothetical protein